MAIQPMLLYYFKSFPQHMPIIPRYTKKQAISSLSCPAIVSPHEFALDVFQVGP